MKTILGLIKALLGKKITKKIRPFGHGLKALFAAFISGYPGHKIKIIAVNGTKGKTTTTIFIYRLMNLVGMKTGCISGALIFDGQKEFENKGKLSTLDAFEIQKNLKQIVKNKCTHVVIEFTSQGLEQRRHLGLGKFETTVFLNAFPEHLEAHGGWGNYIKAKSLMFINTAKNGHFIGNYDSEQFEVTQKLYHSIPFPLRKSVTKTLVSKTEYKSLQAPHELTKDFEYQNQVYPTKLLSDVEVSDLFFALKVTEIYDTFVFNKLSKLVPKIKSAPGRMELVISLGKIAPNLKTSPDFKKPAWIERILLMVDYAHEPESMKKLLETVSSWKKEGFCDYIIHILSSDGAGRDVWKRPVHGDLSNQMCDFTVITTDNYGSEDNPGEILKDLAQTFDQTKENSKFIKIIDRQEAFKYSLLKAKELIQDKNYKVLVFSTGVGTEAGLTQPSGVVDWKEDQKWIEVLEQV
jgi:UDP-N-acetylmuramoyl-L-alanyl-D-glutamate--2,6-diaminopimelate ligase